MDEEENFARLLSASTPAPQPSLYATGSGSSDADPWANPFGGEHDAWGATASASPAIPSVARTRTPTPPLPEPETAHYDERPDPPSVIAAREREELAAQSSASASSSAGFGASGAGAAARASAAAFDDPHAGSGGAGWSPPRAFSQQPRSPRSPTSPRAARSPRAPASPTAAAHASRPAIPAGLIDEDLITERDARTSLTKAFVKSEPAPPGAAAAAAPHPTPEKKGKYVFRPKVVETKPQPKSEAEGDGVATAEQASAPTVKPPADTNPAGVPLPESTGVTPTASRPDTPGALAGQTLSVPNSIDRVSVSPLETPAAEESDFGFRALTIGASGDDSVKDGASRFGGRGWGAIDAEPLASGGDPWGGNTVAGGWGEAAAESEISKQEEDDESSDAEDNKPLSAVSQVPSPTVAPGTTGPRRSKLLSTPVFQITVSDPTKVGDQMRGHVVYTVRTKTTSPHYRRGEFSVLRRFSDFLWLFEQLSANNPGVIVPPVPDKQPFGRFQDQFIETRRIALQRCLTKMTAHPILQLDPDLRLFLESDSFSLDVKNRRMAPIDNAPPTPGGGFMSSWTGPRYTEQDEWFDQRKTYLDHLEGQLKGVSKALDVASKARLEMAVSVGEFADCAQALADSDLGAAMCAALARLADLSRRERVAGEDQAKADVSQLLNLTDEYVRFIASVRLAFASRVRAYHTAQAAEKEVARVRKQREKDHQAGRLGDRAASSMAEIQEAERRARDANADFDAQTKLVKSEFARFERERVDEFRRTLTAHLEDQIQRQQGLVTAWEEYHAMLLKMVQRAQQQHQQQQAAAAQAQSAD